MEPQLQQPDLAQPHTQLNHFEETLLEVLKQIAAGLEKNANGQSQANQESVGKKIMKFCSKASSKAFSTIIKSTIISAVGFLFL